MPYIQYKEFPFKPKTLEQIERINGIIEEYTASGYVLTVRQLYYQLVSRDVILNNEKSYNNLISLVNNARLAGMVDWEAIEDRTRNLHALYKVEDPRDAIRDTWRTYWIDLWERQPVHLEVWYEKDALGGVFQRICDRYDVPSFSCRGYTSQSEMWRAGMRLADKANEGKEVVVLHFGDHDPSGVDMTRDIEDRLNMFTEWAGVEINRLALNMDQVRQYNPPPNFAKTTDKRYASYRRLYGGDSWELDALPPEVLAALVEREIKALRNDKIWDEDVARYNREKSLLQHTSALWDSGLETIVEVGAKNSTLFYQLTEQAEQAKYKEGYDE